jgi:3-oxoacyl-[acyl-carrier-protein] synthase-3
MVPESGRFTVAFAHLTCVAGPRQDRPAPAPSAAAAVPAGPPAAASSPLGEPAADDGEVARWLLLQLALVWADFERRLRSVELVRRIEQGEVTLGEYQRLLVNLRQQVVDGGRWIARAASSMSAELFPLRSAFILHAGEEHRDYQLLEQDYLAVGGSLEEIQGASKNIGSEALSAFIFHRAGQPDPIDLLGAMFVIEGLGAAKALRWAELLQARLGLADDQVRFLRYHGVNDDDHFELLRQFLRSPAVDRAAAERIVKTAKVVARLYALQLEELDHA